MYIYIYIYLDAEDVLNPAHDVEPIFPNESEVARLEVGPRVNLTRLLS